MNIIKKITNGFNTSKKAALYFKTEPFYVNVDLYTHTNNWEILESIKILNELGYAVDLIDRSCETWDPKEKYDLFLGLGVGNAGRKFVKFAEASKAPKKVLLAMGPQPDISNEMVINRYRVFKERTGFYAPPMRTVEHVVGQNFLNIINTADYILTIGEKETLSYDSYLKYKKPIFNFYPSISPKVSFKNEWFETRDMNSFLCFAGNGFICKGVDLVVEAFLKNPSKTLHLCGPNTEKAFFDYYGEKINLATNIKYHGFITPGEDKFNKIAEKCSHVVFHSSSESCCTSIATTMKAGLVPIINKWTGINVLNEGYLLSDEGDLIDNICKTIVLASSCSKEKYKELVNNTLKKAELFSQSSYTESYRKSIQEILLD